MNGSIRTRVPGASVVTAARSPEINTNGTITFRLQAPNARTVRVFTDFPKLGDVPVNGSAGFDMTKDEKGVWSYTSPKLAPSYYQYWFVMDGFTFPDPQNTFVRPASGVYKSIVALPGKEAEWMMFRDVPHGAVEINAHKSSVLGEPRQVFVYTPRRELKRLAKGSTPLDFAFLIHTQVGQHTVGARVNGELVPLRHTLRNGDTVEIITSPQAQPHEDWLKIVRTTGARSKIRHWLRQQRHADSVALGREMVDREIKRLRLRPSEAELLEIAKELGCTDVDQMYARLAEGTVSISTAIRKLAPEKETFAERLAKGPLEALGIGRKPVGGIRIHGIDNVMLHFARCCQPVPGDRVIGIVTQGRGVSVHRQDCPNTFDDRVPRERKVAVEWDAGRGETFPVRLVVYDVTGRAVRPLVDGVVDAGDRQATWDGRDETGSSVGAGMYLVRLEADGVRLTRKMARLR